MSDYVYNQDVNLNAVIASGLYATNALTSAASASQTVTNNSLVAYPKPVGNWSRPPGVKLTNNISHPAIVAFGTGANSGKPLACVKFWAVDEAGTHSSTNIVTSPIIDSTYGDPVPVIEYIGTVDTSSLAASNFCLLHFEAVPWLGTNTLNTASSTFSYNAQANELKPSYCFNDPNDTYKGCSAVVSPAGNDATGACTNAWDQSNPPPAYLTIGAAATALGRTNWTYYQHSDLASSTIYLRSGNYNWTGANVVLTNVAQKSWLTILPFPGDTAVAITNKANTDYLGSHVCLSNITITSVNPSLFTAGSNFWFDRCIFTNCGANRTFDNLTNVYFTKNTVYGKIPQGLTAAATSSGLSNWPLIRGNTITNDTADMTFAPTTVIGNFRTGSTNYTFCSAAYTVHLVQCSYPLIAFNRFMAIKVGAADIISFFNPDSIVQNTNGLAIVQNVVENVNGVTTASRVMALGSSIQSVSYDDTNNLNNIYFWNNTLLGQRCNLFENASGAANGGVVAQRWCIDVKNNSMDQANTKCDVNYNTSGVRVGNWPVEWGVGWNGNTDLEPDVMDSGNWLWNYFGLNSYGRGTIGKSSMTGAAASAYAQYTLSARPISDNTIGAGNGNYRISSQSPLLGFPSQLVLLPYDIDGQHRGAFDPAGAYASAVPRKGAGFFAP